MGSKGAVPTAFWCAPVPVSRLYLDTDKLRTKTRHLTVDKEDWQRVNVKNRRQRLISKNFTRKHTRKRLHKELAQINAEQWAYAVYHKKRHLSKNLAFDTYNRWLWHQSWSTNMKRTLEKVMQIGKNHKYCRNVCQKVEMEIKHSDARSLRLV